MQLKLLILGTESVTRRIAATLAGRKVDYVCLSEVPESVAILRREKFDLALVDSDLKNLEAAAKHITFLCRTPVILVTKGKNPDWSRFRNLEVDGFVAEESNPNEFMAHLQTIVRRNERQYSRARILIIEGDEQVRETLALSFKVYWPEASTVCAASGEDGIYFAKRESMDAILLDLKMPDISGLEALIQIRRFSLTPVIILTSARDEAEVISALKCGADDYLAKPFRQVELLSKVRRHIDLISAMN